MPAIYQGDKKIVDRYIGEKLIVRAYQGNKLIFDAYSELSGTLPLTVRSRASQALKNYIIYGTASGAGVETENLADFIAPFYTYDDFYRVTTLAQAQRKPNCILLNTGDYTIYANLTSDLWGIKAFTETGEVISDNRFSGESLMPHASSQYWFNLVWKTSGNYWYFVSKIDLSKGVVIHLQQPTWILICSNTAQATQFSITPGSTAPSSYIPHGYKLPITVTSNGTTTDYPVYIGNSQLMAEEYVDYEKQKIYKLVDGVLTPTDPPVPLPDVTLPEGQVVIDTEEEFKCHSTIKGRINPVHYAYSINADTAEITYLADNKNFTPAAMGSTTFDYGSWGNAFFMPRPCMLKSDGKVDYYLDPNDYSKKLDGTASDIADPTYDGNVMLEFPKIWYKFEPTGDDGEGGTFHCSNVKLDNDYECWCNYDANNNEIDHFYVHAYNAVILDGKMRSLSGYALTQENGADTTTGATEIAAARANNQNGIDEWYTYLISDHQLLTHLATLMCKHVNHQAKFGRGLDSGSADAKRAYVTGTLNDKGLFWGDTSTGTQGVKIFGIENFHACVWKRAAGLIGTSTGYSYKLTHGTKDGSTATSFNTTGSGYKTIARTKPANGHVTTMHYEANGFWIPATTGANRYGDYHYTGNGYALFGGYSAYGSVCGSWYVALNYGVSHSAWHVSSALSCKPRASASSHNT